MRRILLLAVFVFVLPFFLWPVAEAKHDFAGITDFAVFEKTDEVDVIISMTRLTRPATRFSGEHNCLTLDFAQTQIDAELLQRAFAGRAIKLAYLTTTDGVKRGSRVRFYIRPDFLASVRYAGNDVIVRLTEKASFANRDKNETKTLLNPQEGSYSPAVISLHDAPFQPVIEELAAQAGIEIRLVAPLPEVFSLELETASPVEALHGIAQLYNLRFYREGKVWFMSGA